MILISTCKFFKDCKLHSPYELVQVCCLEHFLELISTKLHTKSFCYLYREPRINEPLYNEVLGITSNTLQPGQSYNKLYGKEPRYNEILVITNSIEKFKRIIHLVIRNKCQPVTKDKCEQTNKNQNPSIL